MKTDTPESRNLKDLDLEDLYKLVEAMGERPYRAVQLYGWLHKRGVASLDEMTNVSKELKGRLRQEGCFIGRPVVRRVRVSDDGTIKILIETPAGAGVESVLIPEDERLTLCVSTQSGCALGCAFCMTAKGGAGRNLTLSEMTAQVESARALLAEGNIPGHERVTNVVLMGMGEPLMNYENVIRFIGVLTDDNGLNVAPRRVTVSTAGVVPMMERLGRAAKVNLAVSLNATTDAVRDTLMPINRKYPIGELVAAMRRYPLKKRQSITIEYVLIKGINDTLEDARRLKNMLRGIPVKINLIAFNPYPGSGFEPPGKEQISAFQKILLDAGCVAVLRGSRGADIEAACGQLKGAH